MTAAATTRFASAPSLSRLFAIELRKTIDTRAGFWLLVSTALATIGAAAITLAAHNHHDLTFGVFFQNTIVTASTPLPVIGILAIAGEWSQRTAMTTFALVPRRERVIVAKLLAGAALALAFATVCLLTSLAATALAPVLLGGDATWDVTASSVAAAVPYMVMWMLVGAGLGLLVMSSAPAIALNFLIPVGLAGLTAAIPAADGALRWIDLGNTSGELIAAHPASSAADWAHVAAGFAILALIPLALGFVRLRRFDVTSA